MKIEQYTLKSGKVKWKFYHYLGIDPDTGKKDEIERQGFNTKGEARDALRKIINEYEQGKLIHNQNLNRLHFSDVVELWLIQYEKQVRISTFTNRKNLIEVQILPIFKDYYVDRIDVLMCQTAVNQWYSSYSDASRLVTLSSNIFKFAINQGFCNENPMSKIIRPKNTYKKDHVPLFYEKEELKKFLDIAKKEESLRNYTIFHVLAFTGLRRGELLGLQWTDIDFSKKTLSVERTLIYNKPLKAHEYAPPKTKESKRTIGIDDTTIEFLIWWRNLQKVSLLSRGFNPNLPTQPVFTTDENTFIHASHVRKVLNRIIKRNDLPRINIHGFRHTHCSLLFEAGIEIQNVKERLGHSDIKTTMNIYAHVTKSERKKTADIFNDFMESSFSQ